VDGTDVLAVADAFRRQKEVLKQNLGPAMLDIVTYRFCAHSASDKNTYRSEEEIEKWLKIDCIEKYKEKLLKHNLLSFSDAIGMEEEVRERLSFIVKMAADDRISPVLDLKKDPGAVARVMFSGKKDQAGEEDMEAVPKAPREEEVAKKARSGIKDGRVLSKEEAVTFSDALFESMIRRFRTCRSLVAYGQENRDWGGIFGVYRGLSEVLPYHRLFNAPISEAAIVGTATGYALCGGRVVAELMYSDFLGRAGDEIFNQLAKWQGMSGGQLSMPAVVRMAVGSKYGAQHSQDLSAFATHVPGLKVAYPSTPYDAKGLLNTALSLYDPVLFFESQRLYDETEMYHPGGVPEGYYEIPFGKGEIKREGTDITILSVGGVLPRVAAAAEALFAKGISAEIFDPRTLVPFDYETLLRSVEKTGRLLLVGDACERGSYLHTIASKLTCLAFEKLKAPALVMGAKNWINPCNRLEDDFFPGGEDIAAAAQELYSSPGARGEQRKAQLLENERLGV
jgi:2-oxoisovalerate dehydrogenase E1 component